ncbi:unnamed protein product [Rotaria socialis]|nr:unnamed protein product [Rotaria socialis]
MTSQSNTISFLVSQKGKPVLVKDNFIYKLNKTTNSTKYYRCADPNFTVTFHTDINDVLVKVKGDHSHPPEPDEIEIRKFKQHLKQRAIQETVPIPKIYDEESSRFCLTSLSIAILPAQREIAGSLNKSRRLQTSVIPDSQTLDIPEFYSKTLKNEPFLCIDKFIRRKTRILVFASRQQLTLLFESSIIFMDGTFSASPSIFDQIYSLHGIKYEKCFACAFGLLPDRKKPTYKFLFQELKNLATEMNLCFNPVTIMSDFETGLAEAIHSEFPNCNHVGCFFHFTQAVYRHIQTLGVSQEYNNNEEVRLICRKLMALSLLPLHLVIQSFDDLFELILQAPSNKFDLLKPLFNYFDNYWIKQVDLKKWNVFGLEIRTNNNAEGFHNRLNARLSKSHPNIWTFIKCIQGEQNRFNHLMIQMKGGLSSRQKTARTLAIQQRLNTLYLRHEKGDISDSELFEGLSYVVAKNMVSKKK